MTHDELKELAADCERRAEAGESPAMEWRKTQEYHWMLFDWHVQHLPHGFIGIDGARMEETIGYWIWDVKGKPSRIEHKFESLSAPMLFVEEVLRRATAPLHAPALRPMSEAPRDDRDILVYDAEDGVWEIMYRTRKNSKSWESRWSDAKGEHSLAGWLPLPEVPKP